MGVVSEYYVSLGHSLECLDSVYLVLHETDQLSNCQTRGPITELKHTVSICHSKRSYKILPTYYELKLTSLMWHQICGLVRKHSQVSIKS